MRPTLVIMVKEPRPGRVKTRLGRDIGRIAAAWWFRHQTRRLLRIVAGDRRWTTLLAVSPDHEGQASRVWPGHLDRISQGGGNLGERMRRVFRQAPVGPVLVVGSDIPGLTRHHIARAFQLLGAADAVLGPATDGGYWCIGLRRGRTPPPGLFRGVRWSTEHAMADTCASLGAARIRFANQLSDVDTAADL
ncbi:MAG: TIGR04282 family arsenosugar biosynthesis glycosyltransferase [Pseudomonadota bacterium]